MTRTLTEYARRPQRAAEADGLNDIVGGISFLAITAMQYAGMLSRTTIQGIDFWKNPAFVIAHLLWVLSMIGMFAVIFLSKRYANTLRERFVYPRIGYVAPSTIALVRRKRLGIALALVAPFLTYRLTMLLVNTSAPLPIWNSGVLVTCLGAIGALAYFSHFAKLGFPRHLVMGGVSITASLIVAALQKDDLRAILALSVILGVSMMIGGAVAFSQILRTPIIAEDDTL